MRIHWHGLEFVGDDGEATYTIESGGLTGVLDGVDSRRDAELIPTADGEFGAPGYLTARTGSISGLVLADSPYSFERAIRRLGSIPVRETAPMVIQSASGTYRVGAQRSGKPDIRNLVYGRVARYQLEWVAPDPRMYGEALEFAGSAVMVYHRGDGDAWPVVEVAGPRGGYTVNGPNGQEYTVTSGPASGQSDRIEMLTGRLYRNNSLVPGLTSNARTWPVPEGALVPMSISSGSMKVVVTDTFL